MLAALRAEYNDEAPPPEAEGAFDGEIFFLFFLSSLFNSFSLTY